MRDLRLGLGTLRHIGRCVLKRDEGKTGGACSRPLSTPLVQPAPQFLNLTPQPHNSAPHLAPHLLLLQIWTVFIVSHPGGGSSKGTLLPRSGLAGMERAEGPGERREEPTGEILTLPTSLPQFLSPLLASCSSPDWLSGGGGCGEDQPVGKGFPHSPTSPSQSHRGWRGVS